MEDRIRNILKKTENSLRGLEQRIKNLCSRYRKADDQAGTAEQEKQNYVDSSPYNPNLNLITKFFLLFMGYIIPVAIYYTDLLLLNDAAEYFARNDMQEWASYFLPGVLVAAELGIIMLAIKLSEEYNSFDIKPRFYNAVQILKFFPLLIVLLSVFVKYSLQVDHNLYILLQYTAFGLLLMTLHLLAIFCGKYLLLGLGLPLHWINLVRHNSAINKEEHDLENAQNAVRDICIKYRTEYQDYLNLLAKAKDYESPKIYNNS